MPTSKRKKVAAAAASKRAAADDAVEEEVFDKENDLNSSGSGKKSRGGKRKTAELEDDNDEEDDDELAEEDYVQEEEEEDQEDEEEAPHSPEPEAKRSKKKGANKKAAVASSPMKDRHINPTGKPAEAGIIDQVYVENFMCHRKLTVKLCRNVNFIHGQNGSGKSAILTAIQVCLGASARRTHRARNLKDLVRKEAGADCSGAKLRVTLLNGGADGYKPDVYGDTISVERTISLRSGGFNGYKLLDCNGKEQSRSKKDLDVMLDQLNIQVENPVAVLDQEEAKKFLTGKDEDKYDFFTKATELERLDRCYASIADSILEQKEVQGRARDNIQGSVENTKQLKKEWEQFQELDKLELEAQELRANYGWSIHSEFLGQCNDEMKKSAKYSRALEKKRVELNEAESSVNVTDDEEIKYKNLISELTEEAAKAADHKRQMENELKTMEAPVKQKERDRKIFIKELDQAKKMHKGAVRRLANARKQILESQGNVQEEERIRTRKIADTEKDLANAKEEVDPLKEQINKHLADYQEYKPSQDQAKETRDGTQRQLGAVEHKLREMQKESGEGQQALAVFGSKCKAMYTAVQKAHRANKFTGPVAGPVGMYVKVVGGKENYAKLAEAALPPGSFDRFIVTNSQDMKLMNKIRRDISCGARDCNLYQLHPQSCNDKYSVPEPPAGVETVASIYSVDNAMAFNFLVDQCSIDTLALTDSKESSEQALLVNAGQGKHSIRGKVRKVYFLPKGDHWEVTKAGNLVMTSNDRPLKQTVGVDRSAAIESTKHEVKALQQELARNKSEEKGIEDAAYKSKKLWNDTTKKYNKVTSNMKKMQSTLDDLKADAETSEEVPTIDTTPLENDIAEAEATVDDLKEKEAAAGAEIETLSPGIEEKKRNLDEIAARNDKILNDMEDTEAKLEDIVRGQAKRQDVVDKFRAKVQSIEAATVEQEETVKEVKAKVADALVGARKLHFAYLHESRLFELKKENGGDLPPGEEVDVDPTEEDLGDIDIVEPSRDSKHYKAKVQNKVKKIEQERKRRNMTESDPAVARDKYMRAKKDLEEKMEQINAIELNCKTLGKDLRERKARWRDFRGHIGEMTRLSFDEFLNKKGSSGDVDFDHENKTLNLVVQKDNTDESTQTKDVKALSGGERSFTTLSLLLAIGESLETPFRVMDEFDVFLDPVARKIAMRTLVGFAKEMGHRQFIFITPQDVSDLQTDNKLKIHKMKPPVRNNKVGGPQQQTIDFGN